MSNFTLRPNIIQKKYICFKFKDVLFLGFLRINMSDRINYCTYRFKKYSLSENEAFKTHFEHFLW